METGDEFLPCRTGRGRGGAERKKRPEVKPGEGPTGARRWASGCPERGVLWGHRAERGARTLWARPGTPEPEWGRGRRRPVGPRTSSVARRPLTCQ